MRMTPRVQRWRHPLIQAQLLFTKMLSCWQRAVVDEGEPHGLLDPVGGFASQQYPGDVRFDDLGA
jgi:hypothetical protein